MKNLPSTYQGWATYLKKARNGMDRPLGSNRRVIWGPGDSIRLRLYATDVVTLHPDGTETIATNGWRTVTTMRFLSEHSRARVWSIKGQWYVKIREPKITPARVRKCRKCTDGYLPRECSGPHHCWTRQWMSCDQEHDDNGRHVECEHGETARHALDPVECHQCKGEGVFDYGSREVHHAWHGEPLTIDADGFAVPATAGPVPTPQTYSPPIYSPATMAHTAPTTSYGDSGTLLGEALPGLRTRVQCPHCDEPRTGPIDVTIVHLNDQAHWTREQVADWLDTLDVDLTFPTPDEIPAHIH